MEKLGFGLKHILSIMGITALFMFITVLLFQVDAIPGLWIGIITCFLYYLLLHYQSKKCASMTPAQIENYLKKGALSRFCLIFTGILLVIRGSSASMIAFVAGFLIPFRMVILFNVLAYLVKELDQAHRDKTPRFSTYISHPLLHSQYYRWKLD